MLKTLHECDGIAHHRLALRPTVGIVNRPVRRAPFSWRARNWRRMVRSGEHLIPLRAKAARLVGGRAVCVMTAELYGFVTHRDGSITDYGLLGRHLVVTAGKNYLASAFDNTVEPETLKYHGYGTGTTAAAIGDTGLQTELTTQYAVDSTRPTGSQAHSSATYTTVATLSPDSGGTIAVTEWGLFSAASSTTLFDRQVFSAVNLVASSDSLTTTYVLTIS
jgi:hypothetical protein